MTEIARYTFHIQSNKRSGGTSTDMTINTVNTIALKSKRGRFQIVVHECTVPFSFYQMSSDISTLQCVFTDTTGNPKTANITLTNGNYTTVSILSELSTKLIAMAQQRQEHIQDIPLPSILPTLLLPPKRHSP
jgi:hypothetical protein